MRMVVTGNDGGVDGVKDGDEFGGGIGWRFGMLRKKMVIW